MIIKEFFKIVESYAGRTAVKTAARTITYGELNTLTDRAATAVKKEVSAGADDNKRPVALLFEHGADMITGVLTALKLQRVYVPLDISYPLNRLGYMLEDSQAGVILTNTRNLAVASELANRSAQGITVINLDYAVEENEITETTAPIETGGKDKPAYILYTSGSTGQPKGVLQTHRNVLYYTRNWVNRFAVTPEDRMTLLCAFSHDGAVQDMFSALLTGAALYPYSIKTDANTYELYNLLMEEKITIWHSVPSLFRYFANTLTLKDRFSHIRWVLLGGEPLRSHDLTLFKSHFPTASMANVYGQTESSVSAIYTIGQEDSFDDINIGEPLKETQILVVDDNGDIIETMGSGEIVVVSDYIAEGYWKNEEASEAVFTDDQDLGRLYWTGDMGMLSASGAITLLGRQDRQIKIRGYRVETGEIESLMLTHPALSEAVVEARKDETDDSYLCAYFVSADTPTSSQLRDFLAEDIPAYMIPRYFIPLQNMPKTPTGKIDRNSLPEPDMQLLAELEHEPPSTETEIKLAAIWSDILGVQNIGINDNFIGLGGHSLLVISIIAEVHKVFDVDLQLNDVFDNPTIKELARIIKASQVTGFAAIQRAPEKEHYEATPDQLRLYVLSQFEDIGTTYNLPAVLKINGQLDRGRFQEAFRNLVQRHEALRTSFKMEGDRLVQVIHQAPRFQVTSKEADGNEAANPNFAAHYAAAFIRPFNLNQAPLMRVEVVHLNGNEHLLLIDIHHIIADGVSTNLLVEEFTALYHGEDLPELTLRYRDYSEWLNHLKTSGDLQVQEDYWLNRFNGDLPVLELPANFPRPQVLEFEGDIITFWLGKENTAQLNRIVKETGTTLYIVLLAIYNVLLHKYSGQEDIVTGSVVAGRPHADLSRVVGLFAKTLPLRNFPAGQKPFHHFLQEVKDNTLQAFEYQLYPFSQLVETLAIQKDRSRNPLFDTSFVLQNIPGRTPKQEANQAGSEAPNTPKASSLNMKSTLLGHENKTARFDLSVEGVQVHDDILLSFQYRTRLFKRQTIELMRDRFLALVSSVIDNIKAPISDLDETVTVQLDDAEDIEFDL